MLRFHLVSVFQSVATRVVRVLVRSIDKAVVSNHIMLNALLRPMGQFRLDWTSFWSTASGENSDTVSQPVSTHRDRF